uniref:Uncharacterized protein n=1 Tax=Arion vulgaris TaxID=1028688 RepID=A0A0B7AJ01_9EUPU
MLSTLSAECCPHCQLNIAPYAMHNTAYEQCYFKDLDFRPKPVRASLDPTTNNTRPDLYKPDQQRL